MSVTLTFVSVSLTRCTVNGATILPDDEPVNQDVDYKKYCIMIVLYKSRTSLLSENLEEKNLTGKHNKL